MSDCWGLSERWLPDRVFDDPGVPIPGALSTRLGAAVGGLGCRVLLNGDGGDEWVDGDSHYIATALFSGRPRLALRLARRARPRVAAWRTLAGSVGAALVPLALAGPAAAATQALAPAGALGRRRARCALGQPGPSRALPAAAEAPRRGADVAHVSQPRECVCGMERSPRTVAQRDRAAHAVPRPPRGRAHGGRAFLAEARPRSRSRAAAQRRRAAAPRHDLRPLRHHPLRLVGDAWPRTGARADRGGCGTCRAGAGRHG